MMKLFAIMLAGTALAMPPRQDLKGATPEQIRAVLPADLLAVEPVDPAATSRYAKLLSLVKSIDVRPYDAVFDRSATASEVAKQAKAFKAKTGPTLKEIDKLLALGPIQETPKAASAIDFPKLAQVKAVLKCLTVFAKSFAVAGDAKTATDMLVTSIKVSDAYLHSHGSLVGYLVSVACEAITCAGIQQTIVQTRFPKSDIARLLSALTPAPLADGDLKTAIRADFQSELMGKLGDAKFMAALCRAISDDSFTASMGDEPPVGSYDAVETTTQFGKIFDEAMANTAKPFALIGQTSYKRAQMDAKWLPQRAEDSKTPQDESAYRKAMSSGKNTIGRVLLAAMSHDSNTIAASCKMRALRDCTRILLASAIHGSSKDEMIPLLGTWPQDPFSGKPMRYDAKKQVAYSVGKDLKDDGGDPKLDVVVSLKR